MSAFPTLTQDQWRAAVEALGVGPAEEWRARNGIHVEDAELPPVGGSYAAPPAYDPQPGPGMSAPTPRAAPLSLDAGLEGLYADLGQSQENARRLRQQELQRATESLRTRRMGPDAAERLYAISGALLAPTRTKGFMGSMANLTPVLGQLRSADREGRQRREDAMQELRQKYAFADIDDEQDALKNKIALYKASRSGGDMGTWSEGLQRFLPKDRAVVVRAGALNGKRTEQMSDGTLRVYEPNGIFSTYDAGGNLIPREQ